MRKEHILVIDDEEDILELVRYNLAEEGFQVTCADSGEDALKLARSKKIDLLVLDLMLPGMNGLEVTKILKADKLTRHIPIIMLTAKDDESDIVIGLELGANDYVTKPFSPKVLIARIKTAIRTGKELSDESVLQIDNLLIHPGRRTVSIGEEVINLTFTEFQMLYFLARRPGWVFTRSQIVDAVRGDNYTVTERSVDVHIVGLRKKLQDFGRHIETIRSVGYRFREVL